MRNQRKRSSKKARSRRSRAAYARRSLASVSGSVSPYTLVSRVLTATLPFLVGGKAPNFLTLFPLVFNLIKDVLDQTTYYRGAYCMFKLTPGSLLSQSPLLAQNGLKYSFPGYPVSIKHVTFRIINTTRFQDHIGKWAAVFIPYREIHDDSHYTKVLKDLTFVEVAAMPFAKSGICMQDLVLSFKMRDKTSYCARPRELTEAVGVVLVVWDNSATDGSVIGTAPTNSTFSCEVDMRAGIVPHVIFGPQHRIDHDPADFSVPCLTDGSIRVHRGREIFYEGYEDVMANEQLASMAIE